MLKGTLGDHKTIAAFVAAKLRRFDESDKSFAALFELMFSERSNIMFERSVGSGIVRTTYGECRLGALKRASALKAALGGIPAGSVIGLYMPNCIEWIELFWAILAIGCRPLLLNDRLGVPVLEQAMRSVGAAAVAARDDKAGFSLPTVTLDMLDPVAEPFAPSAFGESVFVMSSGTSEHVKACEYTAEEFGLMIRDSAVIISKSPAMKRHYKGALKQLSLLPFCHIFGLVAVYIWFAFFSRTFVLLNDLAPSTIIDTIRRHKVTHIFAVPMFWNKVREETLKTVAERGSQTEAKFKKGLALSKKLSGVPLLGTAFRKLAFREVRRGLFGPGVSFMISGGSEIPCDTLAFFNGIGYRLANGYGMTEIGITSVELSSNFKKLCSGSVGLPFSSVSYGLDENGRLTVRGGSLAKRIYEGDKVTERGGEFMTGDLAEFKNGRWFILGRADDVVISPSGENLNPCLIEDKLLVPGAKECCLTSVKENGQIKPVLVVSVDPLIKPEGAAAVSKAVKAELVRNGLDRQIAKVLLVREPLTESGDFKLNRTKVKNRLRDGRFTPADSARSLGAGETELIDKIRGLFAKALGKPLDDVAPDTDFFLDCGGSSLDYFSVAVELQNEYGVAFPMDSSVSLGTPAEIAEFIIEGANGNGNGAAC